MSTRADELLQWFNSLYPVPMQKADLLRSALSGLVEARGVEPLSEDNATQASTGVATVLMSPEQRPVTGYALGQPDCLLQHTSGGDVTAYPTKVEPLSRHMGDGE